MAGVVIVTYNSAGVIDACLDACLAARLTNDIQSIVVVDNASADATVEHLQRRPDVQLIANPFNLGFAAAVNQGFAALQSDAVLILNPDAAPRSGLCALEAAVLRDNVAAATGRLQGSDGADQHGFNVRRLPTGWTLAFEALGLNRLWPGNPINRKYRLRDIDPGSDIEQPAGAFLMVRRKAWALIGGFDESFYPVWFEDVDFCKRLIENGFRIVFVKEAVAAHLGGHSASQLSWKERQLFWYGSLLKYTSKHMSAGSRRMVSMAVMLACVPRTIAGIFRFGISDPVSVYSKVVWLAGQCLRKGERGISIPVLSQPAKEQFRQSEK